jgi:hypothetical protein
MKRANHGLTSGLPRVRQGLSENVTFRVRCGGAARRRSTGHKTDRRFTPPGFCQIQSKVTPIRLSLRQTIWQGRFRLSDWTISLNRSGMKSGVTTSRAAPVSEILRTVQSIAPPPKLMDPALRTRRRGAIRCSSPIGESYIERPRPSTLVRAAAAQPGGFSIAAWSFLHSNCHEDYRLGRTE